MLYQLQILCSGLAVALIFIVVHVFNDLTAMLIVGAVGGFTFLLLGPTEGNMRYTRFAIQGATAIPMLLGGEIVGAWLVQIGVGLISLVIPFPLGVGALFGGLGLMWSSLNFSLFPLVLANDFSKKHSLNAAACISMVVFQYLILSVTIYGYFSSPLIKIFGFFSPLIDSILRGCR